MSAALSLELRDRFRKSIGEGLSGRAAAARLKLSAATGVHWQRKLHENESVAPDITLPELAAALEAATGVVAHCASIGRFLRKLGYTYKKSHWSRPNGSGRA